MASRLNLILEDGTRRVAEGELPLEVESVTPGGVAVLFADRAPSPSGYRLLGSRLQDGQRVRFVRLDDEPAVELEANLIWLEVSNGSGEGHPVELIVTGIGPGWQELVTRQQSNRKQASKI